MSTKYPVPPIADISFPADVIEWRGPAPHVFAVIPEDHIGEIHFAAREASYGWGVVPVEAEIGGVAFATSLFPRNGGYLLPLKLDVRKRLDIGVGDHVQVRMRIHPPGRKHP